MLLSYLYLLYLWRWVFFYQMLIIIFSLPSLLSLLTFHFHFHISFSFSFSFSLFRPPPPPSTTLPARTWRWPRWGARKDWRSMGVGTPAWVRLIILIIVNNMILSCLNYPIYVSYLSYHINFSYPILSIYLSIYVSIYISISISIYI